MFLKLKLMWRLLISEQDSNGFRLVESILMQRPFDNSFLMKMLDYMPSKPAAKLITGFKKYNLVQFRVKVLKPRKADLKAVS